MSVSDTEADALCARLAAADLQDAAAAAEAVAELGKDEASRDAVGAKGAVWEALVALLLRTSGDGMAFTPARRQALRAIGNLCYDHDENRKRLLDAGGVTAMARAMAALTEQDGELVEGAAAVSTGALLNAATTQADVARQLVEAGAVGSLLWLLQGAPGEGEVSVALRCLVELSEVQAAADEICDKAPVPLLVRLMTEAADDEEAAPTITLLNLISRKDSALIRFAEQDTLERLIAASQQTERPNVAKTAALVVSVALADDGCLSHVFPEDGSSDKVILDMLGAWIATPELVDLQIAGAIGIGNFCRSDAHAEQVGSRSDALDGLLAMSRHDWGSVKHAALSSLKNIAKLDANKARLCALGLPAHLCTLVQDPQAPVQYLASSLLRALLPSMAPAAASALVAADNALVPRLVHLSHSEEQAVAAESTRALLNLTKFSRSPEVATAVVDAQALPSFVAMLASEHEMLRVEASVVLALGTAMSGPFREALTTGVLCDGLLEAAAKAERVEIAGNLLNVFAGLLQSGDCGLLDDQRSRIFDTTRAVAAQPFVQSVPAAAGFAAAVLKLEGGT